MVALVRERGTEDKISHNLLNDGDAKWLAFIFVSMKGHEYKGSSNSAIYYK